MTSNSSRNRRSARDHADHRGIGAEAIGGNGQIRGLEPAAQILGPPEAEAGHFQLAERDRTVLVIADPVDLKVAHHQRSARAVGLQRAIADIGHDTAIGHRNPRQCFGHGCSGKALTFISRRRRGTRPTHYDGGQKCQWQERDRVDGACSIVQRRAIGGVGLSRSRACHDHRQGGSRGNLAGNRTHAENPLITVRRQERAGRPDLQGHVAGPFLMRSGDFADEGFEQSLPLVESGCGSGTPGGCEGRSLVDR